MQTNPKFKIAIILFTLSLTFPIVCNSQVTYKDLSSFLELDKNTITQKLREKDSRWREFPSNIPTVQKWTIGKTTLTISNLNQKDQRKIKLYTEDFEFYKRIIRELGASKKFREGIVEEKPKVVYNFWFGNSETAVGQILCSESETFCPVQFDLMKNSAFNKAHYK